jgi:hypothetical protein
MPVRPDLPTIGKHSVEYKPLAQRLILTGDDQRYDSGGALLTMAS